jgi:hypothetical protein
VASPFWNHNILIRKQNDFVQHPHLFLYKLLSNKELQKVNPGKPAKSAIIFARI